ncbi:hypothetical protein QJS04_geneDACA001423 [Acorus gramineus]|uniref:Rhodanese domain-containing protein n=1 Tax=Acorus gramineus TaxID=55184 RepID=A0AAV9A6K3_ACOGR|nr:hypothetical protein QJS04_geneDACA001423 [Acorus gramineus]
MEEDEVQYKKLRETLDSDPGNASHHYNLGVYLWERGEKERASECFVSSAKLNPNNGGAFRFLGYFYASVDPQRAAKCYQRAVALSPDDFEAGEGLCALLDGQGKESLEIVVCREASERSPRAFWAFRRLGYLLVHQKKWSEAVPSLQHAIRGYPSCADLWEALGLAYQKLGMLTAAIKSYGRAVELDDLKVFALVESGNIHLMLGSFKKGIDHFRLALNIKPHYIAANFGLAFGLLAWSKDCVNSGGFAWAASLLEVAYARCFPWTQEGESSEVNLESFTKSIHSWKKSRLLAATSARQSYQRALHLSPWQANIYSDVAISLDLIKSLEEKNVIEVGAWELPEKMSLGGLMLEGANNEIWLVLGCLSNNSALRQHAFIRGLQLDPSFSLAWAHLGKLPEFQLGLGKLATLSGQLLSPQVYGAVQQAIQRAPNFPESHNLRGLLYEARSDYESAIVSYRQARFAISISLSTAEKSHLSDVSFNLARSLCRARHALDAVRECEDLRNEGLLDSKGLQVYALALWQLGKEGLAFTVSKSIDAGVSSMDQNAGTAAIGLICKLLYHTSGLEAASAYLLKMPEEPLKTSKLSCIIATLSALAPSGQLHLLLRSSLQSLASHEVSELHSLVAIGRMITHGSKKNLAIQSGVFYLRKALHMYPSSYQIRLLLQEPWNHKARYLLVLSVLQRAREEKFPHALCAVLKRLIDVTLSNEVYLMNNPDFVYQKFQLLLCASEVSLHLGDFVGCVSHATEASELHLPDIDFFAHLQLCRAYAAKKDMHKLRNECLMCLQRKTDYPIGAICMELARQSLSSEFLSLAVDSLTKAQQASPAPLPIVSALLAQAEASLGAKDKWEENVRMEWFSWPSEMRPAEVYFQMHLLARQYKGGSDPTPRIELTQSPDRWILRAIHLNPTCLRYWKVLQRFKE